MGLVGGGWGGAWAGEGDSSTSPKCFVEKTGRQTTPVGIKKRGKKEGGLATGPLADKS